MKDYKYFVEGGILHRIYVEQDTDPETPRNWDGNIGTMMCWHRKYNLGDYKNNPYSSPEAFLNDLVRSNIGDKTLINFIKNKKASNELELRYNRSAKQWELWGYYYWSLFGERREPKFDILEYSNELTFLIDDIIDAMSFEDKWTLLEKHAGIVYLPLYLYDHSGITMSTSEFSCKWDSGQVGYIYTSKDKILETVGAFKTEKGNWSNVTKKNWKRAAYHDMKNEVKIYDMYLRNEVYGYTLEEYDSENDKWDETESCWGFYSDKYGDALIEDIAREATSKTLYSDAECSIVCVA